MTAAGVPLTRRISAHSGHFPSTSFSSETDTTVGMSSLHPVTYPAVAAKDTSSKHGCAESEYPHGHAAPIDHTVQKLFACMSLAYNNSAQLAAPQFKAYKGLRITVKEKMRLNNIVWREWYLQYVKKRKNMKRLKICNFSPLMEGTHTSPTVIVLEGKYWKRSHEVVKNEYMKWRVFYKESMKHWKPEDTGISVEELLARVAQGGHGAINSFVKNQNIRAHYSPPDLSEEDLKMDLSDSIFSTLHSVGFPHQTSRDLVCLESSDLMQPELIGLEPDMEFSDFDTSEPLQEMGVEEAKELLADAMNLHLEHFKFTSGQKRPVYPEMTHIPDESIMPPSVAYPALKRSRSSTLQEPATNVHILNQIPTSTIDNLYNGSAYITEDDQHSMSILNASGYDYNQNSRTPLYMQATHNPIQPQKTQNSCQTLTIQNTFQTAQNPLQLQAAQNPLQLQTAQNPLRLQTAQNPLRLQTAQNSLRLDSAQHYIQATQADLVKAPGHTHVSTPHSLDGTCLSSPSMLNMEEFSPPPPPYGSSHHTKVGFAADYYSRVPSSAEGSVSSYYASPGYAANEAAPAVPQYAPYGQQQQSEARLAARSTASQYGLPLTGQQGAEFKKPEMKPRLSKPKNEEKSSFLTQLLRKPLDKEVPPETRAPPASPKQPIHSVYFPQFTPISYTPQTSAANSQTSPSFSYKDKSGQVTGVDNLSPPSAEEDSYKDKKETPTAEQKRRYQIKNGFEALSELVPNISTTTTSKTSKATMLSKTIEFINQLRQEEGEMREEIDVLTTEINALDDAITQCQGQLPATGIPTVSRHKEHMQGMLQSYIAEQTQQNWKFYIFSSLTEPLFHSFYSTVSTASLEEMYRSTEAWTDQHCSLVSLRPALMSSLRDICGETSILTNPAVFPDQAREALIKKTTRKNAARGPTE